jgi:hypothetical protein
MQLICILSVFLLSVSAWAGTFKDDFEDGNWRGWKIEVGPNINSDVEERFSIVDGVLRVDARVAITDSFGYDMVIGLVRHWGDYSFSADMRIVQPDPGSYPGGGIALRVEDIEGANSGGTSGYFLHGGMRSWKVWNEKVANRAWLHVWGAEGIDLPGKPEVGKWYRLEIKAIGSKISFYVNGELLFERKDDRHLSGGVSLWAFDAIAEFDNVVITGDDIPDVGPSGYAVQPKGKLPTSWGAVKK